MSSSRAVAIRPLDLSNVLVADLPRGRLGSARSDTRLVALPADLLDALVEQHASAPGRGAGDLVGALAPALVTDARVVLGEAVDPSPDDVAYAVSVAFATRGFGLAAFERWGDALVFVWRDPPCRGGAFRDLAASLAARVVGELTGIDIHGAVVTAGDDALRVLLASAETCALARDLGRQGQGLGAVLDQLSPGASA